MEPLSRQELGDLVARRAEGTIDIARSRAVQLAMSWVRDCTPAALIRFGEGEGRILTAEPGLPGSMRVAANKLSRQIGRGFSEDDVLRIRSMVLRAFDRADVLGIRGSSSFSEEHMTWVRRIEAAYTERVIAGRTPVPVTHCLVNNDLRDALGHMLEGLDAISVVSCRDVAPRLEAAYGVRDIISYQVPSQYVMREVDDPYEAVLHDVPFWPEHLFDLRRRINVRYRGEVFLVGAGILGKELCILIRDRGGIALDLGSTLDGLVGKVTRGAGRPPPYARGPG